MIRQFFTEQFTKSYIKSHFDYRISALYASRLNQANDFIAPAYKNESFDGVYYPSVAMKYRGDNQALFYDAAIRKIELVNAIQVICGNLDFENGTFTVRIMHEAEKIENGMITWKREPYKSTR